MTILLINELNTILSYKFLKNKKNYSYKNVLEFNKINKSQNPRCQFLFL